MQTPPRGDARKHHDDVRIQDLSIKASSSASSHASDSENDSGAASPSAAAAPSAPPPPPPPAITPPLAEPEREAEQVAELRSSPLKRKNKRASLSPTAKRKTSLSDVVVAEGELVVAEAREQREGDAVVLRTLGSIFCVLLIKSRTSLHLETVSPHKHHLIELDLDAMELVEQDALKEERKFKLQRCFSEQGLPLAYVFECATAAQYHKWVDIIVEFRARSESPRAAATGNVNGSSNSNSSSNSASNSSRTGGASRREGDLARASELSTQQRRMRSIASLCDQFPSRLQSAQAAAVLRSPHNSFVFAAPPKTKHVILVRHGHYINAHERGAQDSQQVLSQMGRQQAEFTGKYLEQLYARSPTRHDITIYHSDMTRAVETARAIGKDVGHCSLSATPLLREGWPGRPYSSHESPAAAAQTREQPVGSRAELERIDAERMELAFQTFFTQSSASRSGADDDDDDCEEEEPFSYQVVVCHANLIRFFLCRAMGIEPAGRWGHLEINHCGVSRVDVSEHRPLKILSVNETGHLPPSLITSSEDHL